MNVKIILIACSTYSFSLLGNVLPATTDRVGLIEQRHAQLQEMTKKIREDSITIRTDLELSIRATQLASEQTEREMHCVICESALKDGRPAVEWEANKGISLIYLSPDMGGAAYVKIDETGRVVKVGAFNIIPELVYREKLSDSILTRIRADTNECAMARERAMRNFDEMEAKAKRIQKLKKESVVPTRKEMADEKNE